MNEIKTMWQYPRNHWNTAKVTLLRLKIDIKVSVSVMGHLDTILHLCTEENYYKIIRVFSVRKCANDNSESVIMLCDYYVFV